ncbi:MAG: MbnP family protein [Bacteroidota bacterium]
MKFIQFSALLTVVAIFSACTPEEPTPEAGTFTLFFDNRIGEEEITLRAEGSTEYDYVTASGQAFNLSTFRYYLGKIILTGPDGAYFEDEIVVNAEGTQGYYLVNEAETNTSTIILEGVPAGNYDAIQFIIGIDEEGIEQGAAGGILDPAAGAWFWNWNAGYIGLGMEGSAAESGQQYVDWGGGIETLEGTFAYHIGGWKDVADNENFVNNIKTVNLEMGTTIEVEKALAPSAHVVVDALRLLDGISVDFAETFSVHSPRAGMDMADGIADMFMVHHVHQSAAGDSHD